MTLKRVKMANKFADGVFSNTKIISNQLTVPLTNDF